MLFNNDKAVSPIVATLVLVVVAIAGAAAVGTIMGSFSSDVSDSASAGEASAASSTELLIGGSSTVQPASEVIAEAYMDSHPGVKITVQGGGSGAGREGANIGILDIGSSSSAIDAMEYPDLEVFEIGGSAVVLVGKNLATTGQNITKDELAQVYKNCSESDGVSYIDDSGAIMSYDDLETAGNEVTVMQRADESGTEETFAGYIGVKDGIKQLDSNAKQAIGNAGVYAAVKSSTTPTIGFVDFGFYDSADGVTLYGLDCAQATVTEANVTAALSVKSAGTGTSAYPTGLARNLFYCTQGTPSSVEQSYIDFAMSPGAMELIESVGYFSIYDY